MCSHAIVFLLSFSLISLASDDIRVMNSTQHSIRRSRASFVKPIPGELDRISPTIFWTVAVLSVSKMTCSNYNLDDSLNNCLHVDQMVTTNIAVLAQLATTEGVIHPRSWLEIGLKLAVSQSAA